MRDIDEVVYESMGNASTRDDNLRRILENTEKYEKLAYFTPEKESLKKVSIIELLSAAGSDQIEY